MLVVLGVNALLTGLLALSFSHGPYSSREQEIWYRYGSVALMLAGAIFPALAASLGALRSQWAVVALIMWMLATLAVTIVYAVLSGGGV